MQMKPGYIPVFIDHDTDIESDNYCSLTRTVSVEQIQSADRNVHQSRHSTAKQMSYCVIMKKKNDYRPTC